MNGFAESPMTDHEFAAWLRARDKNWTWLKSGINTNLFFAKGRHVAFILYDNTKCTRKIFVKGAPNACRTETANR